ncbi:MAG: hypothetical protein ABIO86_09515 [Sphingomonas sp.]
MTIALFLLAAAAPCAVPTLCPTAKELISAIMSETDDRIWKRYQQTPQEPNQIVLWTARCITGLSDIVCGDALSEGTRSMNCKYTVHYRGDRSYQIATLVWRDGEWVITDKRAVWRNR